MSIKREWVNNRQTVIFLIQWNTVKQKGTVFLDLEKEKRHLEQKKPDIKECSLYGLFF